MRLLPRRGEAGGLIVVEKLLRYAGLAVGLMVFENLLRYPALAAGLKPSARQGEARLRGLYRIISSTTISPRLGNAKPACAGESGKGHKRRMRLGLGAEGFREGEALLDPTASNMVKQMY